MRPIPRKLVVILSPRTVFLASWKVVHSGCYKLRIYTVIKTYWTFPCKAGVFSKREVQKREKPLLVFPFRFFQVVPPAVPSQHCHPEEHLCREGHSKP